MSWGGWLLIGSLDIPGYGTGFLWALVVMLIAISGVELVMHGRERAEAKL